MGDLGATGTGEERMGRGIPALVTIATLVLVLALAGFGGAGGPGPAPASAQGDAPVGANPVGEPVPVYDAEGDEIARVTVRRVIDPFQDDAAFAVPPLGQHFILAVIAVENTGDRPYVVTRDGFSVLDRRGRAAAPVTVRRSRASLDAIPTLDPVTLDPGDTVSGAVLYRVADDADLVQLCYSFDGDVSRRYVLANLDDGNGGPVRAGDGGTAKHDAGDADGPDEETDETPEAVASDAGADTDTDADPSAADCTWVDATLDRLDALAPAGAELQGMDDAADPDRLREIADDLAAAAAAQRGSNPPAFAAAASDQIATALDTYAQALDAIAAALDAGDGPDTVALLADVQAANGLIAGASAVTGPLLARCGMG